MVQAEASTDVVATLDVGVDSSASDDGMSDASADTGTDALIEAAVDAGTCAMLTYAANNEPTIAEPYVATYPAGGDASVAGQGSNAARVGYSVRVAYVSGGTSVTFGVDDSDVGEGVPWDDAAGLLDDGSLKAFAIDVQGAASTHTITLTFDSPVTGFKFAITDMDFTTESVVVNAFATATGGTPIALTDHALTNPSDIVSLARGAAHSGNDAYVVDSSKVSAMGANLYTVVTGGGVSDSTGTVLFAFDDAQAIQRVEVTYHGSGTGVWLAGMTYSNLCAP